MKSENSYNLTFTENYFLCDRYQDIYLNFALQSIQSVITLNFIVNVSRS